MDYYPVWKLNQVKIKYNVNGGTIREITKKSGTVYNWKTTSTGIIQRLGSTGEYSNYTKKIDYGSETDSGGLANYRNSKFIYIEKMASNAVSGKEWICLNGCTENDKTFSETGVIKASELCDASNGNCTVTLGVNWEETKYKLTYDNNGGTGCSSKTIYYNSKYGDLCTPTRDRYIFIGWFDSNYKDSPLNYYSDQYSDLKNAFGYTANKLYDHYLSYGKNEGRRISQYISTDTFTETNNKTIYAGWYSKPPTYSCPAGYTCTGGACTSTSKCTKTVDGIVKEMYHCPHDESHQSYPTCSYTGWEQASHSLTCNSTGTETCTASTYKCSEGELSGTKCWKYSRYSCPSGWISNYTGYATFSCGNFIAEKYDQCSGTAVYSSGNYYSCTSNNGMSFSGPNNCVTNHKLYNCYTSATEIKHCSPNGKWIAGDYLGCREVGSDTVSNGFKCTGKKSTIAGDSGTASCAISGYTLTRTLYGDCPDNLKFDKNGVKYCDTANDYWTGQSCEMGKTRGASAVYKLTCSKTGTKEYYCDVTNEYTDSRPSNCTSIEETDIIVTY